ncbi:hypothetical protein HELRODRAFT_188030 [Helobdella robusta]|uniref:Uncharacterized protein n=1 Tax=Helobdella robusta TaxID=6412 RepID=T1FPK3_HELRO|nr:hypothetical protein HELRODRAFT_188030 [Helobdella robusta]ESO12895.1 hypothetical protein HELRODRAFT_188030 [Helobdella robusta]
MSKKVEMSSPASTLADSKAHHHHQHTDQLPHHPILKLHNDHQTCEPTQKPTTPISVPEEQPCRFDAGDNDNNDDDTLHVDDSSQASNIRRQSVTFVSSHEDPSLDKRKLQRTPTPFHEVLLAEGDVSIASSTDEATALNSSLTEDSTGDDDDVAGR